MAPRAAASPSGTERFRQRWAPCHPTHFRSLQDLWVSSIGLGTYLGDADEPTDQLYEDAIRTAIRNGCNLIDTAINYRCQRSERVVGTVLAQLFAEQQLTREEIVICTKGGYLPFDGQVPANPTQYLTETVIAPGLASHEEIVAGCHCLSPSYLEASLTTSLANLRVSTIDVYYLHNPEQQLDEISRTTFLARMEAACALLEEKARQGCLRWYGTATWHGYRADPNTRHYLSLQEIVGLARRVGGADHHFRVVQLPYNLAMPEAFAFHNQAVDGVWMSPLEAAQRLGLSVVASASLLQSQLTTLSDASALIPDLTTAAQRAIQFVRSTPGVTTALVGMKRSAHVEENLRLGHTAPLSPAHIDQLFTRRGKT